MNAHYLSMFVGGLLGSGHCLGMCGGFALSIGALRPRMPAALLNQLVYSAGRLATYSFLGALGGYAAARLTEFNVSFVVAQRAVSILAGVLMLGLGCSTLGLVNFRRWGERLAALLRLGPLSARRKAGAVALVTSVGTDHGADIRYDRPDGLFTGFFKHFLFPGRQTGVLLAGVFTGFLPCGLVYAFLALAMSTGDPLAGWLSMVCFGAGTIPAMALLGCGGSLLSARWRTKAVQIAAGFVILLGLATVYRGLPLGNRSCCSVDKGQGCCSSAVEASP